MSDNARSRRLHLKIQIITERPEEMIREVYALCRRYGSEPLVRGMISRAGTMSYTIEGGTDDRKDQEG